MVEHHSVTVWTDGKTRGGLHCEIEYVGEDCFELRVMKGNRVMAEETVEGTEHLLDRAEELKHDFEHPRRTTH